MNSQESPHAGGKLSDADYSSLATRWIDRDLADAARIRRVDSNAGRHLVGRQDHGCYEGLAIPYFLPGESGVREWRLRRDYPEIEYKGGEKRECGKYLAPPGRNNMVYFVPGTPKDLAAVLSVPVIVTEGEFKTLALWRLANYQVAEPRFLPLGLAGVWNWLGTVGKTTGPDGERCDIKGVIPDFNRIVWKDRKVIIAFDADAGSNKQVGIARNRLRQELRTRGAEVAVVTWEISLGKGIDDLLAMVGPERVLELLEQVDWEKQDDDASISVNRLADAITNQQRFAKDAGGQLYRFWEGSYRPDGATHVRQQVKRILERLGLSSKWTSHRVEEVVKYIGVDARILWERPDRDIINVQNGLLNVDTKTLSPHSADFLSPVQLPVKFDPQARCPKWERFVQEVFPGDAQAIAFEIVAWLMTPDTSIQKAVLLTGEGANGKSTYLGGVVAFIGRHNVSAISLHRLETDRFSLARLVGKLANICPDLPSADLSSTSVFKAITGGDTLPAERKFQECFEFNPFSRFIFSANHLPKSQDASAAFFRRWIVVPFERIFQSGDAGTLPRGELDKTLADPTELSGVLNKALAALSLIRTTGLSESDSIRFATDEFRQLTDPIAVWLDRFTVLESDARIPTDQLWQDYNEDCAEKGRPSVSKTGFGLAIAKWRPSVEKLQKSISGKPTLCYMGIRRGR